MNLNDLRGKRIGFLGLGVNNRELATYLLKAGIMITVRDKEVRCQSDYLAHYPQYAQDITWEIGKDVLGNLGTFDIVFRSPGIPFLSPQIQRAQAKGVLVSSQTKLFFDLCPCPIIAVSGSKGKGTTATLIHRILSSQPLGHKTYLAGNIGLDPFSFLDSLVAQDLVILELSSFQLQDLEKSPHIAVLLHVVPEHLDHHSSFEEYKDAKSRLLLHQGQEDIAIVNAEYPDMDQFARIAPGKLYRYSRHMPRRQSAWADTSTGREVAFFQIEDCVESFDIQDRLLLGEHNLENILPAALVGLLCGVAAADIQREVVGFSGLEHRLSHLGVFVGADFYDDSIATTPEACLVALQAFPSRRIHLLLGGSDKGQAFSLGWANEVLERSATVSLLPGGATPRATAALIRAKKRHNDLECKILDGSLGLDSTRLMPGILSGIHPHLCPGDAVVLAPAAPSFASFADYRARGDAFAHAVSERYNTPVN